MHSFLFRMPLVINLRKILPTKSCLPPCGYRSNESNAPTYTWIHGRGSFTSRHSHRSRDRSHWQKTQALRGSRARHGAGTDTGTARGRVCDAAARGSGDARTQRRAHGTGARTDQRRHTTASVAMTKRPGTRARSASQPPESPRPSAISHDSGVNKPATLLLLTQWWG